MPDPTSSSQIDLTRIPGKQYFTVEREWREEFIYFLMVDRFHDDKSRTPVLQPNRSAGIQAPDGFYGGKIKGITNHLDYIAGLGCTAIWLSPVFENNPGAYHGYNINNYLNIDPNFGTKQDLIDLINSAHVFRRNGQPWPMRVILDVVINHSGDNWAYPGIFLIFISMTSNFHLASGDAPTAPPQPTCATQPGITVAAKSEITTPTPR
jgi:1,4-alpha-glucan branching enzyme